MWFHHASSSVSAWDFCVRGSTVSCDCSSNGLSWLLGECALWMAVRQKQGYQRPEQRAFRRTSVSHILCCDFSLGLILFFPLSSQSHSHVDVSVKLGTTQWWMEGTSGVWEGMPTLIAVLLTKKKKREGEGKPGFTTCDNPTPELLAAACLWSPGRKVVPHQHDWYVIFVSFL